jgi:hypothetical protein
MKPDSSLDTHGKNGLPTIKLAQKVSTTKEKEIECEETFVKIFLALLYE